MAKLPGRIPASSIASTKEWSLPEIQNSDGTQTIRLWSDEKNGKLRQDQLGKTMQVTQANHLKAQTSDTQANIEQDSNLGQQSTSDIGVENSGAGQSLDDETGISASEADQSTDLDECTQVQSSAPAVDQSDQAIQSTQESQVDAADQGYKDGLAKGKSEGYEIGEKAGYEEGLKKGALAGEESAKTEFNTEVSNQKEVITNLIRGFSEPPRYEKDLEDSLVDLVTELTKAVVMSEVSTQRSHIEKLVCAALDALPNQTGRTRVFINPSDLTWVESTISADIDLVPDGSLARGGCRVETNESQVNASIGDRIRDALVASLREDTRSDVVDPFKNIERDLQQYEPDLSRSTDLSVDS